MMNSHGEASEAFSTGTTSSVGPARASATLSSRSSAAGVSTLKLGTPKDSPSRTKSGFSRSLPITRPKVRCWSRRTLPKALLSNTTTATAIWYWAAVAVERLTPQLGYVRAIRAALPRDGFFVDEMCQVGYTAWLGLPVYEPRHFVTSGYQGTLGYGFPTALGVKVAHPDKAVVSVSGDGGFLFACAELATAAQYGIGVAVVVFDNGSFGNVRRDQQRTFGRVIGSDLENPDFVRLGESFGVPSLRVDSPAALERELRVALGRAGPTLLVVPIERDSEASPWELIIPGGR
jgi:thiamine pyrophosphate-dependent acetolactate synthase large subunit-like protein